MTWDKNLSSIHHRSESTLKDYKNANPGILGDSKILFTISLKTMALVKVQGLLWGVV